METSFRFGLWERLAVTAFLASIAGVVVSVAYPLAYPESAISIETWRVILWTSIIVLGGTILFFISDLGVQIALKRGVRMGTVLVSIGTILIIVGSVVGLIGAFMIDRPPKVATGPALAHEPAATVPVIQGMGGKGGSGEIFGNDGTIIAGKGGRVGLGGVGRAGDGGGGVIHGDRGTTIGGEGGSVDGINIWFPPAQSGYIQYLESQGQTPDFGIRYPGAGGATGGWLEHQEIVLKIREEYFKKTGQEAKIQSSKIEDVPLEYIDEKLKEAGYPWRARIEKKYWYLYYVP
jgi:hypothetical protein